LEKEESRTATALERVAVPPGVVIATEQEAEVVEELEGHLTMAVVPAQVTVALVPHTVAVQPEVRFVPVKV
jgi:hypothetical protein